MITARIGHEITLQETVRIANDAMNQSVLILGTSGSGKSWAAQDIERKLAEDGGAVVVLDFNSTHEKVYGKYVRRINVRQEGFPFSLLGLDSRFSKEEAAQKVLKLFLGVTKLPVRQKRVLRNAILAAISESGPGCNEFGSIKRQINKIALLDEKLEDVAEAVKDRFFELFNDVTTNSVPVVIPGKVTILDFSGYEYLTQHILAEFALNALWRDVRSLRKVHENFSIYLSLDEFQNLNCRPGGIIEEILREGRKFRLNMLLVTQTLATFSPEMRPILQLPATKLYFPLVEKDRKSVEQELQFPNEAGKVLLGSLQKGFCLATGRFSVGNGIVNSPQILSFWGQK